MDFVRTICTLDEWGKAVDSQDAQGRDLVAAALEPAVPARTETDVAGDHWLVGEGKPARYHLFFRSRRR